MTRFSLMVIMLLIITMLISGDLTRAGTAIGGLTQSSTKTAPAAPAKPADKKEADCGCEAKALPDVLAIVNGTQITIKDVDESLKARINALHNEVIEARSRQLNLEINSRLLESEASRLGITTEKLLEREVGQKIKEPTEAEARAFYDQNKNRIEGEFNDVKGQLIAHLRGQKQRDFAEKYAERLRAGAQVKVLVATATAPDGEADRARVFATINGKPITSANVEDSLKVFIASVQEQVYDLRKEALEAKINDLLLEQEAKRRNMTAADLYQAEVAPRAKPLTDDDARRFYEENKSRITGSFEQLRPQIIQYLETSQRQNAEKAFANELRKGASLQIFLKPPDPPVFDIAIDDRPWRGGASAPVTIVEFTDYECPSCGAMQPVLEEVAKEFGDSVKLVARNFPLDQHKHAFKAAEAAEAAQEQDKYWEYVAILFQNQKALEIAKLKEYAGRLGLDQKRFDAALDSGKFADKIKRDIADGDKLGIDSTPTVFINGKRARDRSRKALKSAIEAALKARAKN